MQNLRPGGFSLLPTVIKNLLIINGLFYLATFTLDRIGVIDLWELLGLYFPASPNFKPFQIVTHMFMHGNFTHLFFNMFALWMFGNALENVWGPKKFLIYYLATGFGASAIYMAVEAFSYFSLMGNIPPEVIKDGIQTGVQYPEEYFSYIQSVYEILSVPVLGASGAVFGILLAFGMTFPNVKIYLYFAIPIKAKYFVAGYGAIELYSGIVSSNDGIAHTAHLGGMLVGYFLIKHWRKNEYREF